MESTKPNTLTDVSSEQKIKLKSLFSHGIITDSDPEDIEDYLNSHGRHHEFFISATEARNQRVYTAYVDQHSKTDEVASLLDELGVLSFLGDAEFDGKPVHEYRVTVEDVTNEW